MLGVAKVPGAIELVQAREGKAGGVADVVQPRGGFQQIGVSAENGPGRGPARRRSGSAPSGGEEAPAGAPGPAVRPRKPACSCAQARQLRRDVHGRGMPLRLRAGASGARSHIGVWKAEGGRQMSEMPCFYLARFG
jgi:hypothetical protein